MSLDIHPAHFGCQVFPKFVETCIVVWHNLYLVVDPPAKLVVLKGHSWFTKKTADLVSCWCSCPLKETIVTYIHHDDVFWGNFALI